MSAVGHFTLETYLEEVALVMRKVSGNAGAKINGRMMVFITD
jgi:hypothetical protein